MKFVDLHSHILPKLDDGAKNEQIAADMAAEYVKNGVTDVVCTPHYYRTREKNADDFREKRAKSLELLKNELKSRNITPPNFLLGAEVHFDCDLTEIEGIEKLAFTGTDYILIEMPDSPWQDWMFDYIYDLIAVKRLTPIIAHLERYEQPFSMVEKLAKMEVYCQVNASSVLGGPFKAQAHKLLKNRLVQLISTDTHNMTTRPPKIKEAFDVISQKYSSDYADRIMENGYRVIKNLELEKTDIEYYVPAKKKGFLRRLFK